MVLGEKHQNLLVDEVAEDKFNLQFGALAIEAVLQSGTRSLFFKKITAEELLNPVESIYGNGNVVMSVYQSKQRSEPGDFVLPIAYYNRFLSVSSVECCPL